MRQMKCLLLLASLGTLWHQRKACSLTILVHAVTIRELGRGGGAAANTISGERKEGEGGSRVEEGRMGMQRVPFLVCG